MASERIKGMLAHGRAPSAGRQTFVSKGAGERGIFYAKGTDDFIPIGQELKTFGTAPEFLDNTDDWSRITSSRRLCRLCPIAPKYADRKGGYTRIMKAGFRLGDKSTKAIFELV